MVQHAQTPYIGSKISLISNSDIRYEGILYTVNTKDATIALAKVRSFGTEDRPTEAPVAPHHETFEYIIFKASDIKDLMVCETPQAVPELCGGLSDPAIVSMSQFQTTRGALANNSSSQAAQSQREAEHAAHAARALTPTLGSSSGTGRQLGGGAATTADYTGSVTGGSRPHSRQQQTEMSAFNDFTSGAVKGDQPSAAGFGGNNNGFQQSSRQFHRSSGGGFGGGAGGFRGGLGGYGGGGMQQDGGGNSGYNRGSLLRGPPMQQQMRMSGPPMGAMGGPYPNGPGGGGPYPGGNGFHRMMMPHQRRGSASSYRGRGGVGGGRGGGGFSAAGDRTLPRNDYDFEKANLKFQETLSHLKDEFEHKVNICDDQEERKEEGGSESSESAADSNTKAASIQPAESSEKTAESQHGYDKALSFFDNISSEASERAATKAKEGERQNRQVDVDTFGSNAVRAYQLRRQARGAYRAARAAGANMPPHMFRGPYMSPYNMMRSGYNVGAGDAPPYFGNGGPRGGPFHPGNQSGGFRRGGARPWYSNNHQQSVY